MTRPLLSPLAANSALMTIMLAAMVALGPLSTDMYLASLPVMQQAFQADVAKVQLTLSAYLIGFAVFQFLFGPLSDRFGRRPVLFWGLLVYGLSGVACALAWSVDALILFRLLQAFGACSGMVIGRAIVRDLFDRETAAAKMSHMGSIMALAPALAPILGGYLTVWSGWQANFVFLGAYGIAAALAVLLWLQETLPEPDPTALNVRRMAANFGHLLGRGDYMGYVLCSSFVYSGLFAFISGSSFVLKEVFAIPTEQFGYFFGAVVVGYIIGTQTGARLGRRTGVERMLHAGVALTGLAGFAMAGLAWAGVDHILAVMAPMVLFLIGTGMAMPQSMAAALSPFPKIAGAAAALFGFLQMGIAALAGALVGHFHDGSQIPMTTAIGLMGLAAYGAYLFVVRPSARARREG